MLPAEISGCQVRNGAFVRLGLRSWQMPICLPFECLCTTHASPGTIPARSNADAVSRAIRWKTAEPSSIGAPRCFDNFTTSPGFCVTRNLRARSREIGDVLNVMAPS